MIHAAQKRVAIMDELLSPADARTLNELWMVARTIENETKRTAFLAVPLHVAPGLTKFGAMDVKHVQDCPAHVGVIA